MPRESPDPLSKYVERHNLRGAIPLQLRCHIQAAHQIFSRDGYSWREWACQPLARRPLCRDGEDLALAHPAWQRAVWRWSTRCATA